MESYNSNAGIVPVATHTEVARWTRGRSRHLPRSIEAVEVDGRPGSVFVANQIIVDSKDQDLIAEIIKRFGAEIIKRQPLPLLPGGTGPKNGANIEDMPLPVLLQLKKIPPATQRGSELLRAAWSKNLSVTSDNAAGLTSLIAELVTDGRKAGLNLISDTATLPLQNPVDSNPSDPFSINAYTGKARVAAAWQLIELFRQFRSTKPVLIGILDAGFWLNGFNPGVASGQVSSDLGSTVIQLNLMDEGVSAGGASGLTAEGGVLFPWHGNGSASVATAGVGNRTGAAGVGGTVASPVLFKTDGSLDQYLTCLSRCLSLGIDVLNISLGMSATELFFPTSIWDDNFKFATDHGLIVVASAGNGGRRLPDEDNIRPATRTPGTITVGAVNNAGQAQSYSNYGSSVNVWAPTDIPVIPDENNPKGSIFSGTSAAAPFVSGILGMMRAVAPINTLSSSRARQILEETGWHGSGKVNIGVDAYAAVLAAMGGRIPDDAAESHALPETARQLKANAVGVLMPFRLRSAPNLDAITSKTHSNWYKFEVHTFSRMDLKVNSYALLGGLSASLEPDDALSRAVAELTVNDSPGMTQLSGLIAPGSYKINVRGPINLYELTVSIEDAPLAADKFEPNETFDTSTFIRLLDPGDTSVVTIRSANPGGIYDLTLHTPGDKDFFKVQSIPVNPLSVPILHIGLTDAPIDITVFDAARNILTKETGQRSGKITLPRDGFSFVEISGMNVTRYRLKLQLEVDPAHLPGPLQGQEVIPLPDLGDPPLRLDHALNHFLFQVDTSASEKLLALAAVEGQPIKVELLDNTGTVVRTARRRENSPQESVELDLSDLQEGNHVLRIGRVDAQTNLKATSLNVQILPSLR